MKCNKQLALEQVHAPKSKRTCSKITFKDKLMKKIRRIVNNYKKNNKISRRNSKILLINAFIGGREAAILIHNSKYILFLDETYYVFFANEISWQEIFDMNMVYLETGAHPVDDDPGFE